MPKPSGSRYHVPNLERGLAILECLAHAPEAMRLSDIEEALGFPKNSVFRIVKTLHHHGYVTCDPEAKAYRLSRKLLGLGYGALSERNLIERSMDVLRALRDEAGETAFIGALLGEEGVVLEQVACPHPVKVLVDPGTRFPLHSSAPGKALLAALPSEEAERLVKALPLRRFNERTIATRGALRKHIAEVRRRGYATDCAEEIEGINCVGAAVYDHAGYPIAAIWVTGPEARLAEESFPEFGEIVMAKANELSRRFGNEPAAFTQAG